MNILVADDEAPCREILQQALLTDPANSVTVAEDGAAAWWHLTDPENTFDLGIFDVKMPVANGVALARRIRANERLRRLPVILCTGYADRSTVISAAQLGLCYCVAKPFKLPMLLERFRLLAIEREKLEYADRLG